MGVAGQEEEEDSEPEPEPEGEPEPEIGKYDTREYYTGKYYTRATTSELNWALECYVCTYEDDEAACAANQTTDSNVETCAPGMHCSVRLTPDFFSIIKDPFSDDIFQTWWWNSSLSTRLLKTMLKGMNRIMHVGQCGERSIRLGVSP